MNPTKKNLIEDIFYGLRMGYELRPSADRIEVLRGISNPVIVEMLEIWESGHGVLPTEERIRALKEELDNA